MTKLDPLLQACANRLAAAGINDSLREARKITAHILGLAPEAADDALPQAVPATDVQKIKQAVAARENRRPLERITGYATIYGLKVKVLDGVFKPYSESEALVEHAHILLEKKGGAPRILDLGTGSGCLLLALLNVLPNAAGIGIDIDARAVALAQDNAIHAGLSGRVEFRIGDWGRGITEQFDLVMANPPRVASGHIDQLPPEMRRHDPLLSLDGGEDGLKFYRMSAACLRQLARPGGYGLFQVGPRYALEAAQIFRAAGFPDAAIRPNYRGLPAAIMVANR